MKTCLFLFTSFLFIGLSSFANTYTVINASDTGAGSLRQAIFEANGLAGQDTIVFDVGLNGANITLATSDTITDSLVIIGSGVNNTLITGAGMINIFVVTNNADVTFKNMAIANGARAIIAETTNGNVFIINCELSFFIQSEAVFFDNGAKSLFIDKCYIHDNSSGVVISMNTRAADFTISNSTISNNTQGRGIDIPAGVNGNTNITNNTLFQNGFGISVVDPSPGFVVNIYNNTVSGNSNTGIEIAEFNGNGTGINMINNISYGNNPDFIVLPGGLRLSNGNPYTKRNIIGICNSVTSAYTCPIWYSSIDPMLGPLQDNGGVTPTMAIGCGSSAYNAGTDSIAITTDQREMSRYGITDIGAYEFQADTSSMTLTACDSIVSPSGNYTWFSSGVYFDTLTNQTGCDSVATINLTINNSNSTSINLSACDSYTWPVDGLTYTSNTVLIDSLINTNGCDSIVTINLTINISPTLGELVTDVTCNGGNDGVVDMTVLGGVMPYTFQWNTGQTSEDLIGVGAGYYELTVIDANGCSYINGKNVLEPSPINTTITSTDATCGQNDGSAIVNITSGGTAPYTYSWSSGSSTTTADSLSAGNYTVQIVDANGCNATGTVGINDLNGPSISLDFITNPSCVGDNDGGIDVTISGGATPYSFNWSQGSTIEDVTGLISGNYSLTTTDANGCEAIASFTVTDPAAINLSNITVIEASCAGTDGSATVTASGGDGNYNYQWSASAGSVTTPMASNLSAGVYSVFVSDGNGCTATTTIGVNNNGGPVVSQDLIIQPACNGSTTGSIAVSVIGGTSPYTYSWNTGQTTEDITGLMPGTYDLTVVDQGGCVGMYVGIVNGLVPVGEDICLVTVDTVSGTNKIVWTKTDTAQISHYNIYREGNSTGVYNLVGSQPVNQLSEWTDPTANPQIRSWRYKISAVDSCNNESQLSASHKTIHLTTNLGTGGTINLAWDYYDGFTYGSYYISRFHNATGWQAMDTLPSTLTSWTDPTPPGLDNSLQYEIKVLPPSVCSATKAIDHNTTRSNRHTSIPPSSQSIENNSLGSVLIYPNPNNGYFTVSLSNSLNERWSYSVLDISGKLILSKTENSTVVDVNLNNLASGIYIIDVRFNNASKKIKIIIQ